MADVYAKSSIYYDAAFGLRVLRETFDGANLANDTAVNQPCLPSSVQANLYEIRFLPQSGDTGNITYNDASGFVPMGLTRRLDHELRKTPSDPDGTYASNVVVRVDVRKISNPTDTVSGNITLINNVTKEASEGGPSNPYFYIAEYNGADIDIGDAWVFMTIQSNILRINGRIESPSTPQNEFILPDGEVTWITGTPNLSNYRLKTTLVSFQQQPGFGGAPTYSLEFNGNLVMSNNAQVAEVYSGGGGTSSGTLTFRVTITQISNSAVVYDKYFLFNARSTN